MSLIFCDGFGDGLLTYKWDAGVASSAPGAKGEANPAEATSPVKGAEPPRPHSAT